RAIYLFQIWLFRRVQSKLPFRRASEPRPRRGGIRLGRRRLSRHRSGSDLRDDRKSAHRAGLAHHEDESAHQAWSGARRFLRRLAVHDAVARPAAVAPRVRWVPLVVIGALLLASGCGPRSADQTVVRVWAVGPGGE